MDPLGATQADLAAAQAVGTGANSFPGAAPEVARQRQADQSSAILKLKGLPYSATENDIRQFFAPYELKGVSFVYEPDGRPSGLAFAEFVSKEEALKALSKNGEYIGQRYVRLLHVPRAEMEEQVRLGTLAIPGAAAKLRSRMMRSQQRNSAVYMATGPLQLVPTTATSPTIKIRGLPYGSSPTEILAFFQTYHYLPDTLQIGLDQLGRPSGEAWLSFSSPQEALRAVRDLNRHYLGTRYLELSIC
ncbi:hypothetical protein VOLCADRAFT_117772 [Volvox carteri f. nagariensis]|uniref:RRM domain-containing protein n=1 Tax=Volvox carteri f. nagariensis TaxID=3068 RepID=D8TXM0_VOLCA|nr:uncharacterized protein VOLCADRAFT_117772 [Volvox carteri f. nagariensis]EFJ47748.1 hypothetical protein VOLCADRAFT_117772 [Volvox carteri f. nagariensis]|eukprot:XP_002951219.1 hypothetical protein VOLCADRAFT_117772 [Volvox carteri f. nagariensis]